MMKNRMLLAILLICALMITSIPVYAAEASDPSREELPLSTKSISGVTTYWYQNFSVMSEAEAKAANVPEGYSGYVAAFTQNGGSVGIMLDLTEEKVAVQAIEKIVFRVYCHSKVKEVRITADAGQSWIMRAVPEKFDAWIDIELYNGSKNFYDDKTFDFFADENGYFKPVNFGFRFTEDLTSTVYIDSISLVMKATDSDPPVIEYSGEKTIETTAGKSFAIDVTAYDEYYKMNIKPEYVYSDGAIDQNGLLLEGEHTCTVRFSDPGGNTAELVISLKVGPKDTEAPVLNWETDKIYACSGMMPVLDVTAVDNSDGEVEVAMVWSEGALYRGKLCQGNHSLTISATDNTGNKVERVISVVVSEYAPPTQG